MTFIYYLYFILLKTRNIRAPGALRSRTFYFVALA